MELRTLLPLIYIVIIILVSVVKSSSPSTVIEGGRLRLMRESGARKGCPSSFPWLDRFIFAFQTPFRTSIALRPFFVAFLLLQNLLVRLAHQNASASIYLFFAENE